MSPTSAPSDPSEASAFLLRHFARLAEAPGGLAKLRALILHLAIEGKLTEQLPADGTAEGLAAELRGKKPKLEAEEQPFSIPSSWRWIRLEQLGAITGGGTPSKSNSEYWIGSIPWISPKDMKREYLDKAQLSISETALAESAAKSIPSGSLLFVVRGMILAHSFPVALTRVRSAINQDMKAITFTRPEMAEYVLRCLKGLKSEVLSRVLRSSHGTCRLEHTAYANLPFPLPPLAEQRRIVAKVEELMSLCDALEAAQQEREALRTCLRTSALHQLASPDSDSKSAAFVLQNLPRLSAEPEDLAHLRRSVLELAVAGKLTRQLKSDETAQKLVERMDMARKALVKPPKLSALPDELPSELPATWTWQPLCALLSEPSQNGYSQSADESPDGVPLLRISAGTSRSDGHVEETDFKRTTLDAATKGKFALQVGDLLAVRFNGNLHFTGKVTIYRGKLGMLQIFPDKLIRLRVWNEFVVTEYVRLAMSAPVIRTAIESFCATTVGNMGISATDLVTVPIPLPPLAEQRRIVAKVDELIAVLDALEAALTTARTTAEKLLAATVARLHAA